MKRTRRWVRLGAVAVIAGAVGLWGWHRIQDVRLRRAFDGALEARGPEAGVPGEGVGGVGPSAGAAMKVVTYNAWALPIPLPGLDRIRRLPRIPGALATLDADLILLQEAFDVRFRAFAAAYLEGYRTGPGLGCREAMVPFGEKDCTGGLMTLSRWPVREEQFFVHPVGEGAKVDEQNGRKGFMVTTIDTPMGVVDVVNIHLYAGRTAEDEEQRLLQLRRLREVLGGPDPSERIVVLGGDLNVVHPSRSAGDTTLSESRAYRFIVDSLGFMDTRPLAGEADLSYDVTTNPYANLWYNRFEGRQLFDYVMTRTPTGVEARAVERRRILDGPGPLSDHYGVEVVLRFAGEPEGPGVGSNLQRQ